MWREIPSFSCSVDERRIMNHFVVVYSNWIALRFSSKGGLKAPKKIA